MKLSEVDMSYLGKISEKSGFNRDTLGKVIRLADVLEYLNRNQIMVENLALKGGTAINLTIFDLPRLSVDIDLDYIINDSRENMLINRKSVNDGISKHLLSQGYNLSPRSKTSHSLDSWIFEYMNGGGNKDNIKIEINYSLRAHVFETEKRHVLTTFLNTGFTIHSLDTIEIFASKINALLERAAARDLYDIYSMIKQGIIIESDKAMLRKCVVFYMAIAAKKIDRTFDTAKIDSITKNIVKTRLLPVLKKGDNFNLEDSIHEAKKYISELMELNTNERVFLERFENCEYFPELLFDDPRILERIANHPMIQWKIDNCGKNKRKP